MQPTAYKIGEGKRKFLPKDMQEIIGAYQEENKELQEKVNTYSEEYGKLREENRKQKAESEELKMWLRENLPLALLKEYMEKFEGVDLKNV